MEALSSDLICLHLTLPIVLQVMADHFQWSLGKQLCIQGSLGLQFPDSTSYSGR